MTLDNLICDNEDELVEELQLRLKGEITEQAFENDNLIFRRFLRARNNDLHAAEQMLRRHSKWRKIFGLDTLAQDYTPTEVSYYYGINRIGFDRDGSPLLYLDTGNMDSRGILKAITTQDIAKDLAHLFEVDNILYKQQTEKLGRIVDQTTYIANFENFSLATATHKETLECWISLILMYEANYPERLKTVIAINASLYFTIMWAVIRPFVHPRIVQKIKIFRKTGWQSELLKCVDPDTLPAFLGGNRTDPDGNPQCNTIIRKTLPVPERLYVQSSCSLLKLPGVKKLTIPRKSKDTVRMEVLHAGSKIEWKFETKSKDIGFALLYQRYGNVNCPVTEIISSHRVEKEDLHAESGLYFCEHPGIYMIEFDNSYSWIHSKEVYYIVSIIPPSHSSRSMIIEASFPH